MFCLHKNFTLFIVASFVERCHWKMASFADIRMSHIINLIVSVASGDVKHEHRCLVLSNWALLKQVLRLVFICNITLMPHQLQPIHGHRPEWCYIAGASWWTICLIPRIWTEYNAGRGTKKVLGLLGSLKFSRSIELPYWAYYLHLPRWNFKCCNPVRNHTFAHVAL